MVKRSEQLLDETGEKILRELQQNARISYKELAHRVNLSVSAVYERVRKMEEEDIITGYRAEVNSLKAGYNLEALVHVQMERHHRPFTYELEKIEQYEEVLQYWVLTGDRDFMLHVAARNTEELNALLQILGRFGRTSTSLILYGRRCTEVRIPR